MADQTQAQDQFSNEDLAALHETYSQLRAANDPRADQVRQFLVQQGNSILHPTDTRSALKKGWDWVNKGLISKDTFVRAVSGYTPDQLDKALSSFSTETPTHAAMREFVRGAIEDTGETASSFTSPMAIGTIAAGGASKIPGTVGKIAKVASTGSAIGFGAQGAKQTIENAPEAIEGNPEAARAALAGASMAAGGAAAAGEVVAPRVMHAPLAEAPREALQATRQAVNATAEVAKRPVQAVSEAVQGAWSPEKASPEQAATMAFRPRNSKYNWQQEIQTALPDMRRAADAAGVDVNKMTLQDAHQMAGAAKRQVWDEYAQNFRDPAAAAQVDTSKVADTIRQTISPRMEEQNPQLSEHIQNIADTYDGRNLTVQELESRVQELNNETRAIEARHPADKWAAQNDPNNAYVFAERNALKNLLISKMDEVSGPGAQQLRQRYGALSSVEDVIQRRIPVAERQAPESLSRVLSKAYAAGKIVRGVVGANPLDIAEGAVSLASQRRSARLNDPDYLTQQAFKNTEASPAPALRGEYITEPEPEQLPPGPKALPPGQYEAPESAVGRMVDEANARPPQLQPGEVAIPRKALPPATLPEKLAPAPPNRLEAVGIPETAEAAALQKRFETSPQSFNEFLKRGVEARQANVKPEVASGSGDSGEVQKPVPQSTQTGGGFSQKLYSNRGPQGFEGKPSLKSAFFGEGYYFGKSPEDVSGIVTVPNEQRNVHSADVSLKKPLMWDQRNHPAEVQALAKEALAQADQHEVITPEQKNAVMSARTTYELNRAMSKVGDGQLAGHYINQAARKLGYDGIVTDGQVVAFERNSLKNEAVHGEQKTTEAPFSARAEQQNAESDLPGRSSTVRLMNPKELSVDPSRFQWRQIPRNAIPESAPWDQTKAGPIDIWKDPADNKYYVVEGHHRFNHAVRTDTPEIEVRTHDFADAKEAKAFGALRNIELGNASPFDAGLYLRETGMKPEDLQAKGVNLTGDVAQKGAALARLSEPIWQQYKSGDLDESKAVAIGSHLSDPSQQRALADLAKKQKLSAAEMGALAKRIQDQGNTSQTTQGLFGADEKSVSNAIERERLALKIEKELSTDRTALQSILRSGQKRAELVRQAGNIVNVDKTSEQAMITAGIKEGFNRLRNRSGDVANLLDEAGARRTAGEKSDAIFKEFYPKIRAAVLKELGGPNAGGNAAGNEGAGGSESGRSTPEGAIDLFRDSRIPGPHGEPDSALQYLVRNLDYNSVPAQGRIPAYVELNQHASQLVQRAAGRAFSGSNMSVQGAAQTIDRLEQYAEHIDKSDPQNAAKIRELADVLDKATDRRDGLNIVTKTSDMAEHGLRTQEEMFHSAIQRRPGQGDIRAGVPFDKMLDDEGIRQVSPEIHKLSENEQAVHVAEAVHDIFSGESDLDPATAARTFKRYLDALSERHGLEPLLDAHALKQFIDSNFGDIISRRGFNDRPAKESLSRAIEERTGPENRELPAVAQGISGQQAGGSGEGSRSGDLGNQAAGLNRPASRGSLEWGGGGLSSSEVDTFVKKGLQKIEEAPDQHTLFGEPAKMYRLIRNDANGIPEKALITEDQLKRLMRDYPRVAKLALYAGILTSPAQSVVTEAPSASAAQASLFRSKNDFLKHGIQQRYGARP